MHNAGPYSDKKGNVIIGSRTLLLGILFSGPQIQADGEIVVRNSPTTKVPVAQIQLMLNLGYIVKAREIASRHHDVEVHTPVLEGSAAALRGRVVGVAQVAARTFLRADARAVDVVHRVPQVRVRARVQWLREHTHLNHDLPSGMGLQFIDPSPEIMAFVRGFIEQREPGFYE